MDMLTHNINVLGTFTTNQFVCCFGVQCFINYHFLYKINSKYNLLNLINVVTCRSDRCALERIIGLLFTIEYPPLVMYKSLLGDIHATGDWGLTYQKYIKKIQNKEPCKYIAKVWTGR
jgi:hypothetical protein